MPSQEKKDKVKQIKKWFEKADSLLVLHYRGLKVAEANELREQVKGMNSELRVLKNTLTRIALADTPNQDLVPMLNGPVAFVFVHEDPAPVARSLREFAKGRKDFFLLGGMLDGRVLNGKEVEAFSMLPSREVLLAQALGTAASPLSALVGVLAGPIRKLLGVIQAIADKAPTPVAPAEPAAEAAEAEPEAAEPEPEPIEDSGPEQEPAQGEEEKSAAVEPEAEAEAQPETPGEEDNAAAEPPEGNQETTD